MRNAASMALPALLLVLGACAHSETGPVRNPRLPDRETVLEAAKKRWGNAVEQIPSFVVTSGSLANVPYSSYRVAGLELNVYGDPEAPACVEVGTYDLTDLAKAEVVGFLENVLPDQTDASSIARLDPNGVVMQQGDLTFEVTPPTAPDAFNGWWISIYAPALVVAARPDPRAAEEISTSTTSESSHSHAWRSSDYSRSRRYQPSAPSRVYVRSYHRRGRTYIPGVPAVPRPPGFR